MKFVTFNIRCDYNQDGNNNFCYRKPLVLEKLKRELPDVICFQEVLPHVASWLKENLEEYFILGCGRDENLEDEQTAIAFKKQKYQLIHMNTFWLSPTPQVPGSRYKEQSICPRTCTEVVLQDLESKEIYRIFNTHLDHEGSEARRLGMAQILTYIREVEIFKDALICLAGDFNATPDAPEIRIISEAGLVDQTQEVEGTYHEYGTLPINDKIDYIFTSSNLVCNQVMLWQDEKDGIYLSDHYPIYTEIVRR